MRIWLSLSIFMACASGRAFAETGLARMQGTAPASAVGGSVAFKDTPKGLHLRAEITGLPPGEHGFHIHEYGSCEDSGKAAGGHYNPRQAKHGHVLKEGLKKAHGGDLGNINADGSGRAVLEAVVPKLALVSGKYGVAGRAVVVHEKADDYGQPLGNAGGRIACGVIVVSPR